MHPYSAFSRHRNNDGVNQLLKDLNVVIELFIFFVAKYTDILNYIEIKVAIYFRVESKKAIQRHNVRR